MGNKANPKVIGAFVVGALVLVVAGIMVFGSGQFLKRKLTFIFYFDGSINGLNAGAPVKFRGVKIGQVTDVLIELNYSKASLKTPVFAEIEPDRVVAIGVEDYHGEVGTGQILTNLIQKGLRAQLEVDSFVTGQLYIELDMIPDTPIRLVAKEARDSKSIEIPTIPSTLQQVTSTLKDIPLKAIFNKVSSALDGIDRFVNSPELTATMSAANDAAREVKRLAAHVDTLVRPFALSVETTLAAARGSIDTMDTTLTAARGGIEKADELADAIQTALRNIERDVKTVVKQMDRTLTVTQAAMKRADGTLASYQSLVAEGSKTRYDLDGVLVEFKAAARSVRILADYLERNPQSLLRGKGDGAGR